MKTLISQCLICSHRPHFPSSFALFNFRSRSGENTNLLGVSRGKLPYRPRVRRLAFGRAKIASESAGYGGWDDSGLDSDRSGEEFRNFLSSIGVDDRKQVFVFVLGLLCALAISRVRVSSIIVFPASVLVFAVGFSFGLVRGGGIGELNYGGNKKRSKEEAFKFYLEKFRNLTEIVDGFDANVSDLKFKVQKAIDSRIVTVSELEDYTKVLEGLGLSSANVRNVIDVSIDNLGSSGVVFAENQKANKRRKESGVNGFNFLQFIGGLFSENINDQKPTKVKNVVKREAGEATADKRNGKNNLMPSAEETLVNPVSVNKQNAYDVLTQDSIDELSFDENGDRIVGSNRFRDDKDSGYQKSRKQFLNNHRISLQTGRDSQTESRKYQDNVLESVNFSIRMKHTETEASFVREQKLEKSDDTYRSSSHVRERREFSSDGSPLRDETISVKDNSHADDRPYEDDSEIPDSSSSTVSDDARFSRHLTEANDLLVQAKEFMREGHEKDRAEVLLYRCAKLLLKAIAMRPVNLLAVGLLGNTYLLHGELKLRISRELRTLLYRSKTSSVRKWDTICDQMSSKDDIASTIIDVCEECEELLVEAGRKYRLALSIDENDVRALYNWGLALTFRAQLISDIGPEASFDADKVFLAAIDKFNAMMSKGSVYAPDALFRWGVVLQQRSRLRPSNSKEKVKLLHQAKRLFQDALDMNSNNVQVREALSTCVSELSSRQF